MASSVGYDLPDAVTQNLLRTVVSLAAHDNRSALEWTEELTCMHPRSPLRRMVADFLGSSRSARDAMWRTFSLSCLALKLADACDVLGGHHHHSTVCLDLEALVSAATIQAPAAAVSLPGRAAGGKMSARWPPVHCKIQSVSKGNSKSKPVTGKIKVAVHVKNKVLSSTATRSKSIK